MKNSQAWENFPKVTKAMLPACGDWGRVVPHLYFLENVNGAVRNLRGTFKISPSILPQSLQPQYLWDEKVTVLATPMLDCSIFQLCPFVMRQSRLKKMDIKRICPI
jgi:hypothetical protein